MVQEDLLLKQYATIVGDPRFLKMFAVVRPERVYARSPEGTLERLEVLRDKGLGDSVSATAHVALQLGLYALEDAFGVTKLDDEE